MTTSPRIVFAGSVGSSRRTPQALLRHHANIVGVLELSPQASGNVSGYCRLADLAELAAAPCVAFREINHPDIAAQVRHWQPDVLFVVGLSQMVKQELLDMPRLGSVGFHPTKLPAGRGRAPVAWLVIDGNQAAAAATFFQMNDQVDAGPIFVQQAFTVRDTDYASDVVESLERAIDVALDRWLPQLIMGRWEPVPQNEQHATWNGKRGPDDGLLDWQLPAVTLHRLIRAASRPHPGAYTYYRRRKLIVWRAELETDLPIRGTPGRVLLTDPKQGSLIQTGQGLLWITESTGPETESETVEHPQLQVGIKLGFQLQDEIFKLHQRLDAVAGRLEQLWTQSYQPSGGAN